MNMDDRRPLKAKVSERMKNTWKALKSASVEPIIFLVALAIAFHNVVYGYGIYRVICKQLYGEDESVDCSHLSNNTEGSAQELAVQRASADWSIQYALAYIIPATFADIVLGALGDRYGRKVNIELGIFGLILAIFPVAIVFRYPTAVPLYVLLIANVASGLTGFSSIVVISSFAYLADTVIGKESLTVRMTLMQVFCNAGGIFGPLMASAMSTAVNTAVEEAIAVAVLAVAFVIGLLVLRQLPPAAMRNKVTRNTKSDENDKHGQNGRENVSFESTEKDAVAVNSNSYQLMDGNARSTTSFGGNLKWSQSIGGSGNSPHPTLKSNAPKSAAGYANLSQSHGGNSNRSCASARRCLLLCPNLMKDVWRTYIRRRQGRTRAYIISASVIIFVQLAADLGLRQSVFSLYVQKSPLNWNQDLIGFYNSVYGAVTTAAAALGIFVFKKLLKFEDTTVVLLALVSGIAECVLLAFGQYTWIIFLSAVAGCFTSLIKPCLKSFVAKLVEADEVGKAFTIFGLAQNVAYLASAVFFNSLYKTTLEVFPGFVYVFAALLLLLVLGLAVWVHIDQKRATENNSQNIII